MTIIQEVKKKTKTKTKEKNKVLKSAEKLLDAKVKIIVFFSKRNFSV